MPKQPSTISGMKKYFMAGDIISEINGLILASKKFGNFGEMLTQKYAPEIDVIAETIEEEMVQFNVQFKTNGAAF